MQKNFSLLLVLLLTACTTVTPVDKPSASSGPSSPPVTTPSPSASATVSPAPSVSPTASSSPVPEPSLSPEPIKNIYLPDSFAASVNNQYISGVARAYATITERDSAREEFDRENAREDLINLNSDFVIINFYQDNLDSDLDGDVIEDTKGWKFYDDILDSLKDKNINIIFNLKFRNNVLPAQNTSITVSEYVEFLEQSAAHFKDPRLSWMIGEHFNDPSYKSQISEVFSILKFSYSTIKRIAPEKQVYMGPFVQSEVFGEPVSYTAENLLSFLNLGIADYTDGFSFEYYSMAKPILTEVNTSFFRTDYFRVSEYYDTIKKVLNSKNIKDKSLFIATSTFSRDVINGITQDETDQSNFLVRAFVYAAAKGFNKVYIPKFFDDRTLDLNSFFQKTGLLVEKGANEISKNQKKLSYWTLKFLNDHLKDSLFKGLYKDLPAGAECFVFEKGNKLIYVLWNNNQLNNYNLTMNLQNRNGKIFTAPTETNTSGSEQSFSLNDDLKIFINFGNNPLLPKIIETEK